MIFNSSNLYIYIFSLRLILNSFKFFKFSFFESFLVLILYVLNHTLLLTFNIEIDSQY